MDKTRGHAAAIITIFVWGVTFISTKILLTGFLPVEILFCRFVIGYLALFAICPRLLPYGGLRQEAYFVAAGLAGICLYYLLENIALTYTLFAFIICWKTLPLLIRWLPMSVCCSARLRFLRRWQVLRLRAVRNARTGVLFLVLFLPWQAFTS